MSASRLLTSTGTLVDIAKPDPSSIHIVDIAHHLARICRFNGAVQYPYSVAQHSLMVSELVHSEHALPGLLHDAAEAYLGDISTPVKALLGPAYADLERRWNLAIGERFGLGAQLADQHPAIKAADDRALATERRDLMPVNPGWKPTAEPYEREVRAIAPEFAKDAFLNRFDRLNGGKR